MLSKKRLDREKKTLKAMVEIYCKAHHRRYGLCSHCSDILDFAFQKLDKCPFRNEKPT